MLVTLAAIGAFLCLGISNFLGPLVTRRTPLLTVIAGGQAVPAVLLGLALVVFALPLPGFGFLLLGLAAGALTAVLTALAFRAGQIGNIGLVAMILSLSAIIPAVAGIAGGERPPIQEWLGIGLAAGGTGLALLAGGRNSRRNAESGGRAVVPAGMPVGAGAVPAPLSPTVRSTLRKAGGNWPLMAVGAALSFGLFMLVFSELAKEDLIWASFLSRVGMVGAVAPIIVARGKPIFSPGDWRRQAWPLPFLGLFMTSAIVFFGYAASSKLTVTSALMAFAPVVAVTLSWLILHERLTRAQMVGIAIAISGLVLIAV